MPMIPEKYRSALSLLAKVIVWMIILIGIVLRLVLYFQNRNLIIDEANIVRNLHERNFIELVLPLKYEQYAPPIFLWIEELLSLILGYGEKALRLYPLLSGIASLIIFRSIMRRFVTDGSLWLPMALLSFTYLLIKYSVELKQYMPDAMITLLLVWLALRKDIFTGLRARFILFWCVAGSIAIWASMPSVFCLAAIGIYYFWQVAKERKWDYLRDLIVIAFVWLGQFAAYYWFILKPQIESDYLQGYHFDYFLYGTPSNIEEWKHNYDRIKEILNNVGGYNQYSFYLTSFFVLAGIILMVRKNFGFFILVTTPIILTLLAAALNQYTLIDRVILFLLPLFTVLLGYGVDQLWRVRFFPIKVALVYVGVFMIWNFNMFWLFERKLGFQELTEGMDYLKVKGAKGDQLFVHDASVPPYIYYTELHPDKNNYQALLGAHILTWDQNYADVTLNVSDTAYFIYTGGFPDHERNKRTAEIEKNMQQVDYFRKNDWFVFVYTYAPKYTAIDTSAH
jgi:hypothetical protein